MLSKKIVVFVILLTFCFTARAQYFVGLDEKNVIEIYEEANEFYDGKMYEEAHELYVQILRNNPEFEAVYLKMGYNYFNMGLYEEAISILHQSHDFRTVDNKYFYLKAQCFDKLKKYNIALKYLELAMKAAPNVSQYLGYRANLLMEMRKYKQAVKDYDKALELKPDQTGYLYNRGIAYFNLKNYHKACGDWYLGKSKSKSCNSYYFYKCTKYKETDLIIEKPNRKIIELPVFLDGDSWEINQNVATKLIYPDNALINNVEGTVIVSFYLKEGGVISNIKIEKSVQSDLDSAAVKYIKQISENWTPYRENDKVIKKPIYFPVNFRIKDGYPNQKPFKQGLKNDTLNLNQKYKLHVELLGSNPLIPEYYGDFQAFINKNGLKDTNNLIGWYNDFLKKDLVLLPKATISDRYVKLYYNDLWELTTKEKAKYYRITQWTGIKFFDGIFADYTIGGNKVASGAYAHGTKTGDFDYFYPNGTLEKKFHFRSGENETKTGPWKLFFPNGELYMEIDNIIGNNFQITQVNDSLGKTSLINNSGTFEYTYSDYLGTTQVVLKGEIKNTFKHGTWQFYIGDELLAEEFWAKGKFLKGFLYNNGTKSKMWRVEIGPWVFLPHSLTRTEQIIRAKGLSDTFMSEIKSLTHK